MTLTYDLQGCNVDLAPPTTVVAGEARGAADIRRIGPEKVYDAGQELTSAANTRGHTHGGPAVQAGPSGLRVGVMLPQNNTTVERELPAWLPFGASVEIVRIPRGHNC